MTLMIFLVGKFGMKFHWSHTSEPFLATLYVIKIYIIFNCRNQFVSRIEFPKIIHFGFRMPQNPSIGPLYRS